MKLTLDRDDLKIAYRQINCSQTKYEHFYPAVQKIISAVGEAQFVERDGKNYNAIYPSSRCTY